MKKVFITLIIFTFLFAAPSKGLANFQRCSEGPKPKIIFESSYGRLSYNYQLSQWDLTQKSTAHRPDETVRGLAQVEFSSTVGVTNLPVAKGDGYCVTPTEIEVFIGMKNPVIYISRELVPNSCEYTAVMRHEQTHMQIYIRTFDHFLKVAPAALEKISREIKPIYVTSLNEANEAALHLQNEYVYIIQNFTQQLYVEADKEHLKLDGEKGKQFEASICQ